LAGAGRARHRQEPERLSRAGVAGRGEDADTERDSVGDVAAVGNP
jgi:hypothetical protein